MVVELDEKKIKAIEDLKVLYPKVTDIANNWLLFCHIHGEEQSEEEQEILSKFSKAMKEITK